jgi:hypothetical protein
MRALLSLVLASASLIACGSDGVDSDEEARRAYLALDESIGKSLTLGFAGFGAGDNANIPDQETTGADTGTLLISGKVDAGNSANKVMTLNVGMVDYSDGEVVINDDGDTVAITYNTDLDEALQPVFDIKLQNFPNGTFTGTVRSMARRISTSASPARRKTMGPATPSESRARSRSPAPC